MDSRDEKWPVRYKAALALGEIGDERAVPALEEAVKGKNKRGVCKAAQAAVKKIESKKIESLPEEKE